MNPNCLRVLSLLILASGALTAQVARQETVVPLKNWATPLYWQPNQTERGVAAAGAQLTFSSNQVSSNALTFIAITPCRLVDTQGAAANFNGIAPFSGPSIPATMSVTFPVQSATEASTDTTPAPCGTIPSIAQAYSLNLTVVPVAGGAVDYISMWPSGYSQPFVATLNDPQGAILANAAIVPAGTVNGGISVYNQGPAAANVIIDMNGFFVVPTDLEMNTALGFAALQNNTTGTGNTASGNTALASNTTGDGNTAMGDAALASNTTAGGNTGIGGAALAANTTGGNNTALGNGALQLNTTGSGNTANGQDALVSNTTGVNNTAVGQGAMAVSASGNGNTSVGNGSLRSNISGFQNTAIGISALANSTGNTNIAVGEGAGSSLTTGNSNIDIGNQGVSGETSVIRIGSSQTSTYIAGIWNNTPNVTNLLVCVDANGDLGTTGCTSTPSSRRFKEQIADMGDSSSKLLQLRPVTFFYKPQYDDGSHALQYGLIAEEVAPLFPDMVGYDKDGEPNSVKYQSLAPMLLNEVEKQVQLQREENRKLEEQNRKLEERLAAVEALLSAQAPTATRAASSQ